jgi:hypothetical protein
MRGRSDQASLSLQFLPVCFPTHAPSLSDGARVRVSEQFELITREMQVSPTDAKNAHYGNGFARLCCGANKVLFNR